MKFLRIFSFTFFTRVVQFLTAFGNSLLIVHTLGSQGRGEYALIMNFISTISLFFGQGISSANTYLISRDKGKVTHLASNSIVYAVICAFIFSILLYYPQIFQYLLPGVKPVLIILGLFTAAGSIVVLSFQGIFTGLQRFNVYNILYISPIAFLFTANLLSFKLPFFSNTFVFIYFSTGVYIVLILAICQLKKGRGLGFRTNWLAFKETIHISWKAALSYIAMFYLFKADLFIINAFLGIKAVGIYSIATLLASFVQYIPNVAGVILFPKVSKQLDLSNFILSLKIAGIMTLVGSLVSIFLVIGGKQLILFLYTDEFLSAYKPLLLILPGIILMAPASIFNVMLRGQGFPPVTIIAPSISLIINIILNIVLIPKYGINGAAVATLISYIFFSIIIFVAALKTYYNLKQLQGKVS